MEHVDADQYPAKFQIKSLPLNHIGYNGWIDIKPKANTMNKIYYQLFSIVNGTFEDDVPLYLWL